MNETKRVSGLEMARVFYQSFQLDFQRVVSEAATDDGEADADSPSPVSKRGFPFSDDRFDDWAVSRGYLQDTARSSGDDLIRRRGLTEARHRLRLRINRAARDPAAMPRPFVIEARYGKWRVMLLENFLYEHPVMLLTAIVHTHKHFVLQIEKAKKLVAECEYLDGAEKTSCQFQLESAAQYGFFARQQAAMALAAVRAARDGMEPDFASVRRQLQRYGDEALDRATGAKPPMKAKAKHRRRTTRRRAKAK